MPNNQYADVYEANQARIERQRKMAQLLQQESMTPIEAPSVPGAQISPYQGLAKLLQAALGGYTDLKLSKAENQNTLEKRKATAEDIAAALGPDTKMPPINQGQLPLAPSPQPMTPNEGALMSPGVAPGAPDVAAQLPKPYQYQTGEGQQLALQMALQKRQQDIADRQLIKYNEGEGFVDKGGKVILPAAKPDKWGTTPVATSDGAMLVSDSGKTKPLPGVQLQNAYTTPTKDASNMMDWRKFEFGNLSAGQQSENTRQDKSIATTVSEGDKNRSAADARQSKQMANALRVAGLDQNGNLREGHDATAQMIANYQTPSLSTRSMSTPAGQAIMAQVLSINPDYRTTDYDAKHKTAIEYSPGGGEGKNLVSADTALGHLNSIAEANAALKNGDLRGLNTVANAYGVQTGATPKTTFDAIVRVVAPEISKAVVGGVTGEAERQQMEKSFPSSGSWAQNDQSIGAVANLLAQRIEKKRSAYKQQMGRELPWEMSPSSKAVLQRYGAAPAAAPSSGLPAGWSVTVK